MSDDMDPREQVMTPMAIEDPGRILRIGSVVRQLLDEMRSSDLDEASRERVTENYQHSVKRLLEALPPKLQEEFREFSGSVGDGVPSEAELIVVHAQVIGWLQGLFQSIQAAMMGRSIAGAQTPPPEEEGRETPSDSYL